MSFLKAAAGFFAGALDDAANTRERLTNKYSDRLSDEQKEKFYSQVGQARVYADKLRSYSETEED